MEKCIDWLGINSTWAVFGIQMTFFSTMKFENTVGDFSILPMYTLCFNW